MGFSGQGHWSGLPCPPPEDLPDPGIERGSFTSPALADSSLPLAPPGKPLNLVWGTVYPLPGPENVLLKLGCTE